MHGLDLRIDIAGRKMDRRETGEEGNAVLRMAMPQWRIENCSDKTENSEKP